jgi:large subunit ribosomal protein L25
MNILEAKDRAAKTALESGLMPAVFYGKKTPSTPISLALKDFIKVWKVAGESGVVTIKTPKATFDALIHEVDVDPVTDVPRHADFYVFEKGKKLEVSIPLEFEGVSPAVKDLGGSLVKVLHELKISAEPQNLPHEIKVDISSLVTFDDVIIASQIKLPTGVNLEENPEEVVASAARPKEDEPQESAPIDLSAIEVEKKGKKEEEGASTESAE